MKIIIALFLLMSFSSLANDGIVAEKTSYSIETSIDAYPGGKKKKNRKGKRANKKRMKHCRKMHRNRGYLIILKLF